MIQTSLLTHLLASSCQATTIKIIRRSCLRSRLSSCQCTLCIDCCPNNALFLEENTVTLNDKKCQGCMLCSTVCPNDALSPNVDLPALLVDDLPDSDSITFTCNHQQQFENEEVVLPCLATLPAEALVYLCLAKEHSTVFFNAGHCSTCHNHKSFKIFKEVYETVSHATRKFANSSLTMLTEESRTSEPTRRVFLKSIKNSIASQRRKNDKARLEKDLSPPGNRTIRKRSKLIKEARTFISPSHKASFSELTESSMTVNDSCIPCNRCTGICPTGALSFQKSAPKKELTFTSDKCNGCQLCVLFCKQKALTLAISPLSRITAASACTKTSPGII